MKDLNVAANLGIFIRDRNEKIRLFSEMIKMLSF
jgi:hypothetical protein